MTIYDGCSSVYNEAMILQHSGTSAYDMNDSNGNAPAIDLEAQFSLLPLVLQILEKVHTGTDELEISKTVSAITITITVT